MLIKQIIGQFEKVTLADGSLLFNYDDERVGRIVWKRVRGIYFTETARVLPERTRKPLINLSSGAT